MFPRLSNAKIEGDIFTEPDLRNMLQSQESEVNGRKWHQTYGKGPLR